MLRRGGEEFVKTVFQDREAMVLEDAGVKGSDINGHHDGVRRERDHMIPRE